MALKFIPKNNNVSDVVKVEDPQPEKENIKQGDIEFPADSKKRKLEGIKHMFWGFLLSSISFFVACWTLSSFEVGWFVKSFAALAFSALVINAYNSATGKNPTPMRGPVFSATIILFVLCLFTGYQNSTGKSAGGFFDTIFFAKLNESALVEENNEKVLASETGTVKAIGDIWFASRIFSKGETVEIIVEYNAVQVVNGRVLEPGIYKNETMNGDGQLMFEGVATNPSRITVIY